MEREARIGMWDEVAAVKSALELVLDQWDRLPDAERKALIGLAVTSASALIDTIQRYDSIAVELNLDTEDTADEHND